MKKRTYSKSIANVIKNYLTEDGWQFSFDEEEGLFWFGVQINSLIRRLSYVVDVKVFIFG